MAQLCRSIHLTNDAIQKQCHHYSSFEDHNKLDLKTFQEVLDRQGDSISVENSLLPQMREAAADVFSATLHCLNNRCLSSCFELFGLDFMVDHNGKVCSQCEKPGLTRRSEPRSCASGWLQVYLIEVNSCPALALQGRVLEGLLPRVIEEAFQKAVDPLFPGSGAGIEPLHSFQPLPIHRARRPLLRAQSFAQSQDRGVGLAISDWSACARISTCATSGALLQEAAVPFASWPRQTAIQQSLQSVGTGKH
jgi:hypothetical protein